MGLYDKIIAAQAWAREGSLMPITEGSRRVVTLELTLTDSDRAEIVRMLEDESFHSSPRITIGRDGSVEFSWEER